MMQMFRPTLGVTILLLAACGEAPPANEPAEPATAQDEVKTGKGTGTVTALDAGAGTITIDHAPMPDVGWSAMTMTFDVDPTLLAGIAEGDSVAFDLTVTDNRGEITAIVAE